MTAHALGVNTVAATQFVAARVVDGTSSNTVGNLVAVAATVIAAVVMGFTLWFAFEAFREKKGKFKKAMPEILGITACGAVLGVIALKIPNVFGLGNTFLADYLPF
jgi:heme/copper-type cytochrome/quinol oxidase subunit 2